MDLDPPTIYCLLAICALWFMNIRLLLRPSLWFRYLLLSRHERVAFSDCKQDICMDTGLLNDKFYSYT